MIVNLYPLEEPELKSCPFCGSPAEIDKYYPFDGYQNESPTYVAKCTYCPAKIKADSKSEAIERWNRRKNDTSVIPKKFENADEGEAMSITMAMEGPNQFKDVKYKPTCRYGCDDCIYDPAYIKATYPKWYAELYGEQSPEEAAQDPRGCMLCKDSDRYDDEDK